MLGELAVLYLFLGGTGAACLGACSLIDLVQLRRPFGAAARELGTLASSECRVVAAAFLAGFLMLVFGVLCLLLDLGKGDRALDMFVSVFASGTANLMTAGVYGLSALGVLGAVTVAAHWLYLPWLPARAVRIVEAATVPLALFVMAYTGFLLQTLGGFSLWKSSLIPVLFVLSSASCGMAVVLVCCVFFGGGDGAFPYRRTLFRIDGAVVLAEAVAAAAFLVQLSGSDHGATRAAFENLVAGDQAFMWWCGFVGCAVLAPLLAQLALGIASLAERFRSSSRGMLGTPAPVAAPTAVPPCGVACAPASSLRNSRYGSFGTASTLAIAALVLTGGLCLRVAIVDAAEQPDLELQKSSALDGALL